MGLIYKREKINVGPESIKKQFNYQLPPEAHPKGRTIKMSHVQVYVNEQNMFG